MERGDIDSIEFLDQIMVLMKKHGCVKVKLHALEIELGSVVLTTAKEDSIKELQQFEKDLAAQKEQENEAINAWIESGGLIDVERL